MSFTVIDRHSLMPGQWVAFSHEEKELKKELQGPFKVINRDDAMMDYCRCFLMNVEGKLMDYCPRMGMLGLKDLPWGYTVKVYSKERIAQELGEKLESIQNNALDQLKWVAQHPYFGRGFDPEGSEKTLTGREIREKYGLTLKQ